MARDFYRYDLEDLVEAANGMQSLRSSFENASSVREEADDAFGYPDLKDKVKDFVDNWKHNRERQLEAIGAAHEALQGISEGYVEFDANGVAELQDEG
jgi:hypothetical protein